MEEMRKVVLLRDLTNKLHSMEIIGYDFFYQCFYIQVNGMELTWREREYLENALGCIEHEFKAPRKRRFYLPPGVRIIE